MFTKILNFTISKRVKDRRIKLNLTQDELSDKIDINRSYKSEISHIENGKLKGSNSVLITDYSLPLITSALEFNSEEDLLFGDNIFYGDSEFYKFVFQCIAYNLDWPTEEINIKTPTLIYNEFLKFQNLPEFKKANIAIQELAFFYAPLTHEYYKSLIEHIDDNSFEEIVFYEHANLDYYNTAISILYSNFSSEIVTSLRQKISKNGVVSLKKIDENIFDWANNEFLSLTHKIKHEINRSNLRSIGFDLKSLYERRLEILKNDYITRKYTTLRSNDEHSYDLDFDEDYKKVNEEVAELLSNLQFEYLAPNMLHKTTKKD